MVSRLIATASMVLIAGCAGHGAHPPMAQGPATSPDMSFFITSVNPGKGGNLGGLAGADAYSTALAESVGVRGKTWRTYLSTTKENARDRIGQGPWKNAKGVVVTTSVADLHGANNKLSKESSLSEKGRVINGRRDEHNRHDVMTGSNASGTLEGNACNDWTSQTEGSAMVGHHDRTGGGAAPTSWNAAHASRSCSTADLRATGGDGLFYCFAAN